jgi:hypothetical protein
VIAEGTQDRATRDRELALKNRIATKTRKDDSSRATKGIKFDCENETEDESLLEAERSARSRDELELAASGVRGTSNRERLAALQISNMERMKTS